MSTTVHLAVSVALQNAGEATRALAIARAVRDHRPPDREVRITFLSTGSRFDPLVDEAGFEIHACEPRGRGRSFTEDLQRDLPEIVGSEDIARALIEGQLEALREVRPDAVLHGFWPFGSLAARMLELPTIAFLPIPLHPECLRGGLFRDLPDEVPLLPRLPRPVRRALARAAAPLLPRAPFFHQRRLGAAAARCGWPVTGALDLWEANRADLTLLNDLPRFHHPYYRLPADLVVTGPVYPGCPSPAVAPADGCTPADGLDPAADLDPADGTAPADGTDLALPDPEGELDPDVVATLRRDGRPAVLVAMGSSGTREVFLEAVRAVTGGPDPWNVVVLAPPATCSLAEARAAAGDDPGVLVTDRFVPALAASRLADVVVGHGGQGTVQTTMAAGTPLVGVGTFMEQQVNLDRVMDAGAGIRIQQHRWRAPVIRRAVRTVLADGGYRWQAQALSREIRAMDGPGTAAERIWKFLIHSPFPGSPQSFPSLGEEVAPM